MWVPYYPPQKDGTDALGALIVVLIFIFILIPILVVLISALISSGLLGAFLLPLPLTGITKIPKAPTPGRR
jgi:hypothetical protein